MAPAITTARSLKRRRLKTEGLGTLSVWAGEDEYFLQGATRVPVVDRVSFGYNFWVIPASMIASYLMAAARSTTAATAAKPAVAGGHGRCPIGIVFGVSRKEGQNPGCSHTFTIFARDGSIGFAHRA